MSGAESLYVCVCKCLFPQTVLTWWFFLIYLYLLIKFTFEYLMPIHMCVCVSVVPNRGLHMRPQRVLTRYTKQVTHELYLLMISKFYLLITCPMAYVSAPNPQGVYTLTSVFSTSLLICDLFFIMKSLLWTWMAFIRFHFS